MLHPGSVLAGRYAVRAPLGAGGMAGAFSARDLLDDEDVALKVLVDERLSAELRAEFELLSGREHPRLARVRAYHRTRLADRDVSFYSADLIAGEPLDVFAARAPAASVRAAVVDVLDALAFLHRLGLRHGDVKPDNVLVRADGRAVLIDLGCAARLREARALASGTPTYMAPEVLRGECADERADLFAVGVMLRTLPQGAAPRTLIARLTAERAAERPSSAAEVIELLGDARAPTRTRVPTPPGLLGRDVALTKANAVLDGARPVSAVWIHGPSGVGRSRLLRELAWSASRDHDVIEARASHAHALRRAMSPFVGELAPGLEGVVRACLELAEGDTPTVLVLDDIQRATPSVRDELAAVLRALPRPSSLSFVLASTHAPQPSLSPYVESIALEPLDKAALRVWVGDLLGAAALPALLRHTGGYPRDVARTLEAIAAGRVREADLGRASSDDDAAARALVAAELEGLDGEDRELLLRVAVWGRVSDAESGTLGERGLVRREGHDLVLARASDRAALLAAFPARRVRALHLARARELEGATEPEALAACLEHLLASGERARALAMFERAGPALREAPRAFVAALLPFREQLPTWARLSLASCARLAGEPRTALSLLAAARRAVKPGRELALLHREAVEVYLALGRPARAARHLPALDRSSTTALDLELAARVALRRSAYEEARELASRALASGVSAEVRARVLEALATAEGFLGHDADALTHVAEAASLHASSDARARVRCLAFQGFVLLRAAKATAAADAYARALEEAEARGYADLVVNALLNLGSARQMLGAWASCLVLFERALVLARALGRAASVRTASVNLANVWLEIGAFARAEAELDQLARDAEPGMTRSMVAFYRAELALLTGDPRRAAEELERADVAGMGRETIEAELWRADIALAAGEVSAASSAAARAKELVTSGTSLELRVRTDELAARVALARGEAERAVRELEAALSAVRGTEQEHYIARIEGALADACAASSLTALADEHRRRARARWERIALDLAPSLRDAFWAHPRRRAFAVEAGAEREGPRGRSTLSLHRLFELARRINSVLTVTEVLEHALDAAIELTGAERGFVLLVGESRDFTVAAARHLDHRALRRREHKVSRGIAERVIETGEPVLTFDAGSDTRFARQASVHAMRLKSVLCVPVRSPGGVLGAIYLDNRLERARFAAGDRELLLSFADQVAVALINARLVSALEEKSRELAREKRRVEELARGQAEHIERLSHELDAHRAAFATRYDYAQIVGRSEPMRRVLSVLDRVIDTELSVLVQGESGTGKELIARAVHAHSRRKDGPFVGLNVAALPETLLESELFGYVKGAFTGADRDREGLFAAARGGTLFLDELGEMPLAMQAKLLRALQDREVRPVGATRVIAIDVRLVAATNRNLEQRVREGAFREDLYYRLAVVNVTLPPLRERSEDIVPLAEALLTRMAQERGQAPKRLAPEAVRALLAHPWPGNVRELENTLARASVMAAGPVIRESDLGLSRAPAPTRPRAKTRSEFESLEAERLVAALESNRWNVSQVARMLGIPRNTLYRKLARYGIRTE